MLAPQMTTSSKAPAGKSPLVRSLLAVIVVAFLSGCFSAPDGNITDPGTQSSTSATGPPPGYGEFYLPEAAKTGVLRDGECLVGLCLVAGRPVVEDGPAKGLRVALAPDPEVDYMLWRGRSGDINNGILHNRDQAQPDWPIKIETIIYNLEEHWLQGVHLWDRDISLRYLGHDVGNVYYGMMHDFDPVNDDVYGRVVVWNRSSESVTLASDAFFNDTMEVSYPWLLAENQTDPFEPSPHAAYYVYNLETGAERLLWKADEGPGCSTVCGARGLGSRRTWPRVSVRCMSWVGAMMGIGSGRTFGDLMRVATVAMTITRTTPRRGRMSIWMPCCRNAHLIPACIRGRLRCARRKAEQDTGSTGVAALSMSIRRRFACSESRTSRPAIAIRMVNVRWCRSGTKEPTMPNGNCGAATSSTCLNRDACNDAWARQGAALMRRVTST
jgi:hypothetical protein